MSIHAHGAQLVQRVLAASLVAALVSAGCSSNDNASSRVTASGSLTTSRASRQAAPSDSPGPRSSASGEGVPAGFVPVSVTAISDKTFWVLGSAGCPSPSCLSILRTTDGGKHWIALPPPPISLSAAGGAAGVSSIRFVNAKDGYAAVPDLWYTHDGGRSWRRDTFRGTVKSIESSNGAIWMVAAESRTNNLFRWNASGYRMQTVFRDTTNTGDSLAFDGPLVWITGGGSSAQDSLFLVNSKSHRILSLPAPCEAHLGTALANSGSPTLWALCVTGTQAVLKISRDGGQHFSLVPLIPSIPNTAIFGAIDQHRVVIGPACGDLSIVDDQGKYSRAVSGRCNGASENWVYVGFTDATHGFALRYEFETKIPRGELWHTTDGGANWSKFEF